MSYKNPYQAVANAYLVAGIFLCSCDLQESNHNNIDQVQTPPNERPPTRDLVYEPFAKDHFNKIKTLAWDQFDNVLSARLTEKNIKSWTGNDFETTVDPLISDIVYLAMRNYSPKTRGGFLYDLRNANNIAKAQKAITDNTSGANRDSAPAEKQQANKTHQPVASFAKVMNLAPNKNVQVIHAGNFYYLAEFLMGLIPGYRLEVVTKIPSALADLKLMPQAATDLRYGIQVTPEVNHITFDALGKKGRIANYMTDRVKSTVGLAASVMFEVEAQYLDMAVNYDNEAGFPFEHLDKIKNIELRIYNRPAVIPPMGPAAFSEHDKITAANFFDLKNKLVNYPLLKPILTQ